MSPDPIRLPEDFDLEAALALHGEVRARLGRGEQDVAVDLGAVRRADAIGVSALLTAHREARRRGSRLRLVNLSERHRRLFAALRVDRVLGAGEAAARPESFVERVGDWGLRAFAASVEYAALHVDALRLTLLAPFRRRGPQSAALHHQIVNVGVGSVGIVVLISFLIGLIMALQAAYQLRQFGAVIFVANMVGVAMTRELGPLLTAVVLSARSGSSIAAELGTMVVTEEVDALRVMDIEPRRYLVAPRFAAMLVALPCLTTLSDVAGILGGFSIATLGLGIGPGHYWEQTVQALYAKDLLTGVFKAVIFANIIAIVACREGLSIRGGPEEVGRATTRSVVTSILLVIVSDFVFTSIFYLFD